MNLFNDPEELELMSANEDGTSTYRATLRSSDGNSAWVHTGSKNDCEIWLSENRWKVGSPLAQLQGR